MENSELEGAKYEFLRQIYDTPLVMLGAELRYLFQIRYEWREIEINGGKVGEISAENIPNKKIGHITSDCLDGCLKARLLLDEEVIEAIREKIQEEFKEYSVLSDEDKSRSMINLANWIFINQMLVKGIIYGQLKTDLEFLTEDQDIEDMDPVFASIIKEEETEDTMVWQNIEIAIANVLQQMSPTELITVLELAEVENMADGEALDNELYSDILCGKIADISESDLIRYYEDMDSYITEFDNLKLELKKRLMKTNGVMAPLYLYFADLEDSGLNNALFDKASTRDIAETLSNAVLLIDKNIELRKKVLEGLNGLNNIQFLIFILEIFRMRVEKLDDEILIIIQEKISKLSPIDRQALREVFKDEGGNNQIRTLLMQVDENEPEISQEVCQRRIEQFNLLGGAKQSFPMLKYSPDENPAIVRILTTDDEEISDDGTSDYDDEYEDEEEQDPYAGVYESLYQEIMKKNEEREQCINLMNELDQLSDRQIIMFILDMAKRVDGLTTADIENIGLMDFSVNYLKNRILYMDRKVAIILITYLFQNQISEKNVIMRTTEFVMEEFKEMKQYSENTGNGDGR